MAETGRVEHHRAVRNNPSPEQVRCVVLKSQPVDPETMAARPDIFAVDLVDHARLELLADHGMSTDPPVWQALVWTTGTAAICDQGVIAWSQLFDRHPVWGDPDSGNSRSVLMVSLVVRLPQLDHGTFVDRYRNHAAIARRHHGFTAYRQNVVPNTAITGADRTEVAAVSEIRLASELDWRDHFYRSPQSADAVGLDVRRFLDRGETLSTLVRRFH